MRGRGLLAALSLAGSLVVASGCSTLVPCSNAGIPLLESGAPGPVSPVSTGAKYVGWTLGAPLALAVAPFALVAWATPWVDLADVADACTAPAIGIGYALEALVGFPTYATCAWADERDAVAPIATSSLPVPWGFVVAREPAATARPAEPIPAHLEERYAPPLLAPERLVARIAAATPDGDGVIAVRLEALAATLELTLVEGEESRPLVLMTPPSQATFAARWLAARYARRSIHAAVIVPDADFLEPHLDAAGIEAKLGGAVIAARTVVAALARKPQVSRIAYLGVSAGGIFGALLAAVEPRIDRFALVFPGGDVARMVATSEENTVRAYRDAWAARGVDTEALARSFERAIVTDPVLLARHADPARIRLFLSDEDTLVPIECGRALQRALGTPETWLISGDHETAGLCFGFVLRSCDDFLLPDPEEP